MVAGAVALSLALHGLAIGWLRYGLPSFERGEPERTVEVALLAPPPSPEPPAPPPPPKPMPKPRPKPPPPAEAPPREAAISTAPAPEPAPEPSAQPAEPARPAEPPAPAAEPSAEPAEPQPVQPMAAARPSMWGVPVRPQAQAARGRYLMHLGDYESSSPIAELEYVLEVGAGGYSMRTNGVAKGLLSCPVCVRR